ncbi:MAG: hypothetical protein AB1Z98_11180 [Nannocystaceae bacterium]
MPRLLVSWVAACGVMLTVGACDGGKKVPSSGSTPPPSEAPAPAAEPSAEEPPAAEPPDAEPPAAEPPAAEACGETACTPPQQCITYYGIAGPSGPEFKSCEIPCKGKGGSCPEGLSCVTIADGPGSVCREAA